MWKVRFTTKIHVELWVQSIDKIYFASYYAIFTYDLRQAQAFGGKSCQSTLSSSGEGDVDNGKRIEYHRIHARKSGKDEVAFCIMRCRHINMEPVVAWCGVQCVRFKGEERRRTITADENSR
jgi:hypothetical protein